MFPFVLTAQSSTYKIGKTEYYVGKYYSTTGKPMVKRSEANKKAFLRSMGMDKVPAGFEVDHITPLSKGGLDEPFNMQLLTKQQHANKTARERSYNSSSTYTPKSFYRSSGYASGSSSGRVIQTGPRGGQYYINSSGNKVYVKKN